MMQRRTAELIAAFRRALKSQSKFSDRPRSTSAAAWLLRGRIARRSSMAEDAIRLSPLGSGDGAVPRRLLRSLTIAAGRYAESLRHSEELLRSRPGFQGAQRLRCASLAQTGRIDEARSFLAMIRREHPQLSIEWVRASVPYQTPVLMERFLEGLRKAGLNET